MITLNTCPVCDGHGITGFSQVGLAPHVSHEIMPGVKVEAAIITRYSSCQDCHLIFQNPRLSDEELDKFYSRGYYRSTLNLTDKQIDEDELYRAKTDADIIKQQIGTVTSHLDIGCSRGYLLEAVGAQVKVGVEANVDWVKVKGVKVYPKMSQVPEKSFDLVTAIHVLEHVSAPLEDLRRMVKLVGRTGYLIVEVPTWKSPGGPLRLAHLYHFEPDILRQMCRQVGLRVVQTLFTPHLLLICQVYNTAA